MAMSRLKRFFHCLLTLHRAVDIADIYSPYGQYEIIELKCECGISFWKRDIEDRS